MAQLPQSFGALGANGTVENSLQQTFGLVARQRLQLQPPQQAVFPQRRNSVGCGLASADSGDHTRHILQHQLMHDQRREVVEQVRVVDEYQQRARRWRHRSAQRILCAPTPVTMYQWRRPTARMLPASPRDLLLCRPPAAPTTRSARPHWRLHASTGSCRPRPHRRQQCPCIRRRERLVDEAKFLRTTRKGPAVCHRTDASRSANV